MKNGRKKVQFLAPLSENSAPGKRQNPGRGAIGGGGGGGGGGGAPLGGGCWGGGGSGTAGGSSSSSVCSGAVKSAILFIKACIGQCSNLPRFAGSRVTSFRTLLALGTAWRVWVSNSCWEAEMKSSRNATKSSKGLTRPKSPTLSKLNRPSAWRITRRHKDCRDSGVSKRYYKTS